MSYKQAHKIKNRKNPKDVFYTPFKLVETHLNMFLDIPDNSTILDPFAGKKVYYDEMKKRFLNCNIEYTEIEEGLDFFNYDGNPDYIISNPPYSLINDVLEHSVNLKPKVISYLLAFHNITPKRIEYMNNNGYFVKDFHLTKVYSWFGFSIIITFSNEIKKNVVTFDKNIHKNT